MKREAGFTLIELLVAMSILMVIVLMMANIFQQSTNAWDAGVRQVEVGLEGRSVIGMMRGELAAAFAEPGREMVIGSSRIEFYTRAGDFLAGDSHYQFVEYERSGGNIRKTTAYYDSSGAEIARDTANVLENAVADFSFDSERGTGTFRTNIPAWVEIDLEIEPVTGENAIVKVWSEGPEDASVRQRLLLQSWGDES